MPRGAVRAPARTGLLVELVGLLFGAVFSATAPAQKIVEVHAAGGGFNGYTEIQFTADGEGSLAGKHLVLHSPGGTVLSDRELTPSVAEGGSQRTALIANGLGRPGSPALCRGAQLRERLEDDVVVGLG